jgi:peptidoglycan/LPS O-acetylase OafA/YrhL
MRKSFGDIFRENGGVGHGFDFVRVVLALSVLGWHEIEVFTGDVDFIGWPGLWMLHRAVLPMFFGLSGFLVAGSAQRLTLGRFAINRGFRIVPALAVEILLSAIVIGPLTTSVTISRYFGDVAFWTYLLNIVGIVHFRLPGVLRISHSEQLMFLAI